MSGEWKPVWNILRLVAAVVIGNIIWDAIEYKERACARDFGTATKDYALCVWEKEQGK